VDNIMGPIDGAAPKPGPRGLYKTRGTAIAQSAMISSASLAEDRTMRCYFMRGSKIANVEFLKDGSSDDELIQQALAVFEAHSQQAYDGFEVWDGKRFVYRYTAATKTGERRPLAT
jgi:hypothetical protein